MQPSAVQPTPRVGERRARQPATAESTARVEQRAAVQQAAAESAPRVTGRRADGEGEAADSFSSLGPGAGKRAAADSQDTGPAAAETDDHQREGSRLPTWVTTARTRWARPAQKKRKADVFLRWERRVAAAQVASGVQFAAAAEAAQKSATSAEAAAAASQAEYESLAAAAAAAVAAANTAKEAASAAAAAAEAAAADSGPPRATTARSTGGGGAAAAATASAAAPARPHLSTVSTPATPGCGGPQLRRLGVSRQHKEAAPIGTTRPPLPPRPPHRRSGGRAWP